MLYLFDANMLLEANNRYYGLDFAPGFWEFIERESIKTTLKSSDMIFTELKSYGDAVSRWVDERKGNIFDVSSDEEEIQKYLLRLQILSIHILFTVRQKKQGFSVVPTLG